MRAALDAWTRTDDRLTSIPLLAVGAEVLEGEAATGCVAALSEMAAAHIPLAEAAVLYAGRRAPRRGPGRREQPPRRRRGLRGAGAELVGGPLAVRGRPGRWPVRRGRRRPARGAARLPRDGRRRLAPPRRGAPARHRAAHPHPVPAPDAPGAGLSARELEVLAELSLGLRNRDIGERLFISERTVARHLVQINAKLGVSNRTAAVRVAQEMGLLSPRELGTTP